MPDKKADYICECFKWIEQKGGYVAVKKELLAQTGRDAKVKYLRQLKGVGEKNARNMMMSVYHSDFRDSIAVDVRIKSILETLNVGLTKYQEQEGFLLGAAKLARLNGWELDRLMYGYLDEFLAELHRRIYGDVSICEA
jgi:hypothetical protein